MHFKLHIKILIPIFLIITCSFIVANYFIIKETDASIVEANLSLLLTTTKNLGENIDIQVKSIIHDAEISTKIPDILLSLEPKEQTTPEQYKENIKTANHILNSVTLITKYYETFYTTNEQGLTLASSLESSVGKLNISNRDWFHNTIDNNTITISEPFISRISGKTLVAVCLPISYKNFKGTMTGSIYVNNLFNNILQSIKSEFNGISTLIVTKEGNLIGTLDDNLLSNVNLNDKKWFSDIKNNQQGILTVFENNTEKYVAFYKTPQNWFVLNLIDKNLLLKTSHSINIITILTLLIALLLTGLILYYILKNLLKDINQLNKYVSEIGAGNLESTCILNRHDEIGTLKNNLDLMLAGINNLIISINNKQNFRSKFASTLSHEVYKPLSAIISFNNSALNMEPPPAVKDYLIKIKDFANKLMETTNYIELISNIENNKLELELKPFSLLELFKEIMPTMQMSAEKKNLELNLQLGIAIPDNLIGDRNKIKQILTTLTENAIKFTDKGNVKIGASITSITDPFINLRFFVEDTGIGLSLQEQQELVAKDPSFDSFTQKNSDLKIGLTVTNLLLSLMESKILIESQENKGSVFSFILNLKIVDTEKNN